MFRESLGVFRFGYGMLGVDVRGHVTRSVAQ
jgi:hypothetical protein